MAPLMKKVLIANRGEIAVRVARTLREMGIGSVAVYSEPDHQSLHVRVCDEAYPIGPAAAAESYLVGERLIEVAKRAGCDGVHPGYGFLSENAAFAEACEQRGLRFIGPPASAMRAMGLKTAARERMAAAGVPIVPGGNANTAEEALETAERIGYPVMLKATAGGGGKGMRLVHRPDELTAALERAQSEALKAFGDPTVYLEKAIIRPRHVEIQVLGDQHGNMVHLFERDCSIQRRHQKVVEEAPCPAIDEDIVRRMGEVAVKGAQAVGYYSAGTFEFLLSEDHEFYFLEMNTRLQVEHPVTELITGVDLVREMVRVAAGLPISVSQSDLVRRGAAIECRVYAEDPSAGFLPSPGTITALRAPSGPGVRDDSGAYPGCTISPHYDPLVSKLSVWAPTREQAVERLRRALREYLVSGIRTNLPFHQRLVEHPDFIEGRYDTGFIDRHRDALLTGPTTSKEERAALAQAIAVAALGSATSSASLPTTTSSGVSPWLAAHRATLR
ncbi:MAG: acetyl-CoA carboxylase biotin carboxylase subunit [Polyangiaceae bacterium]|nr:acetyl-CoA carboxylase biotin carboxylase subunit [Polyangiaceae bacterium]MCW5792658.1 acetyl-CoA carboxylase biotin carboxylase subunit [Polyangiaceae bacterium]